LRSVTAHGSQAWVCRGQPTPSLIHEPNRVTRTAGVVPFMARRLPPPYQNSPCILTVHGVCFQCVQLGATTIYLTIDHNAGIPVSAQIADQITYQVVNGTLAPGTKIPSVRGLAAELKLNPTTVARVYQQLETEGVIETRRGRGTFIAARRPAYTPDEQARRLAPLIRNLVLEAGKLGLDYGALQQLINTEVDSITREIPPEHSAAADKQGDPS